MLPTGRVQQHEPVAQRELHWLLVAVCGVWLGVRDSIVLCRALRGRAGPELVESLECGVRSLGFSKPSETLIKASTRSTWKVQDSRIKRRCKKRRVRRVARKCNPARCSNSSQQRTEFGTVKRREVYTSETQYLHISRMNRRTQKEGGN